MFARLGRLVTRHPRSILVVWAVVALSLAALAMSGVAGDPLFAKLETGEPTVPGSQSEQVSDLLRGSESGATTTLLVTGADLADPTDVAAIGEQLATVRTDLLDLPGVDSVTDPFQHPLGPTAPEVAALVGTGGDAFVLTVTLETGLAEDTERAAGSEVAEELETLGDALVADSLATGADLMSNRLIVQAVNHQMESDLIRGELVALPVALLVMIVVFGGALAAGMPIVGALASIGTGLGAIWALSFVMDLDSVVINVVTLLGLGLSIDYGLLIVSRFREELRTLLDETEAAITAGIAVGRRRRGGRRRDPLVVEAVRRTVSTAGRTVVFSALTIAICVLGLAAMPPSLLKGLGVSGFIIVLIALLTAITLVPALLVLSGRRFLRPSILSRVPGLRSVVGRLGDVAPERGAFSAIAGAVQRRAWVVMVVCFAALLVFASPLMHLNMRNSGVSMLPEGSPERTVLETLDAEFPALRNADVYLVPAADAEVDLESVIADVEAMDHVDTVMAPGPLEGTDRVSVGVVLDVDPGSPEAVSLVHEIRDRFPDVLVGGQAAGQIDFTGALLEGLPLAGGMVILATFVLLFLMTGSVLVPAKALLTNMLSIAASLGITTWAFQDGHLAGLLGFTSSGGLESYVVAVVIAFGFGLAMDYEVFLLARIKELYDKGMSNDDAVRLGLQRSGRIITSAALVIIVVFAGFASGELLPIKEAGFALALAVALDATLVRVLLVPATMTVLGEANWWSPRWLRPLATRFAITH